MKQKKKLLSLILILVMALPLAGGFISRADTVPGTTLPKSGESLTTTDTPITVTLRVEQDAATELTPVNVTLTAADKRDFGIGLSSQALTPLHALAKYLAEEKKVSDADMNRYIIASPSAYGLYVTGISINGDGVGAASANADPDVYWNYRINDSYMEMSMDTYELKDKDSIVFYGLWSPYPADDEVLYTHFDKAEYSVKISEPVSVVLNGAGTTYDENFNTNPYTKAVANATITAMEIPSPPSTPANDIYLTASTDGQGKASLTFHKAGCYALSATRMNTAGTHCDISRPYAIVNVSDASTATATPAAAANPSATVTPSTAALPSQTPASDGGAVLQPAKPYRYKLTKPGKIKASVKKSKTKKKTVALTWKKAKCSGADNGNVTGYEIFLSKKKNGSYKKVGQTTKTKLSFKRKTGICYLKIRAYKTAPDDSKYYSAFRAPLKIKVR